MTDQSTTELSERELEILRLVATGASNKEIAQKLVISPNTVKVHLRNIFTKIGVTTRTEAAMYAVRSGIVPQQNSVIVSSDQEEDEKTSHVNLSGNGDFPAQSSSPLKSNSRLWRILLVMSIIIAIGFGLWYVYQRQSTLGLFAQESTLSITPSAYPRWRILAEMPTARFDFPAISDNGQIYVISGETSQGITGTVDSYDPNTNSWKKRSPKPTAVVDVEAGVVGGLIYVPGGRLSSGQLTNVLEAYDPLQDLWEQRSPVPVALNSYALATLEGKLYIFGGWDGQKYLNTVYIYDPNQDKWTTGASMPTYRSGAGAAVSSGKIYVIGGYDGKHALSACDVYTPSLDNGGSNAWQTCKDLPEGRDSPGVTSIADIIHVVGGKNIDKNYLAPLFYSSVDDSWHKIDTPKLNLGNDSGVASQNGFLYVIGGHIGDNILDQTLSYQVIYSYVLPIVH